MKKLSNKKYDENGNVTNPDDLQTYCYTDGYEFHLKTLQGDFTDQDIPDIPISDGFHWNMVEKVWYEFKDGVGRKL